MCVCSCVCVCVRVCVCVWSDWLFWPAGFSGSHLTDSTHFRKQATDVDVDASDWFLQFVLRRQVILKLKDIFFTMHLFFLSPDL